MRIDQTPMAGGAAGPLLPETPTDRALLASFVKAHLYPQLTAPGGEGQPDLVFTIEVAEGLTAAEWREGWLPATFQNFAAVDTYRFHPVTVTLEACVRETPEDARLLQVYWRVRPGGNVEGNGYRYAAREGWADHLPELVPQAGPA